MSWRDHFAIHPAAELFPLMSEAELRELADDINQNGLHEPPSFYDDPELGLCVLDGRNRLDALELLGRPAIDAGCSVGPIDPFAFVVSKNIRRRHLNVEQRQELLMTLIARQPERSDRQIAKAVGVDHKTVGTARAKGEELGSIPQLEKTIGADGKSRKTKRPPTTTAKAKATRAKATATKVKTPAPIRSKRMTAFDVLELWRQMPPEEDRRVLDAMGLKRILAAFPESWLPFLEKWIEERQSRSPPAEIEIGPDLSIPDFLRRPAHAHPEEAA